ncbi:hypothetical protein WT98_09705 [Burkholderia territorii]|nr:hypothetical protein WT98_09705 [Burkholderia territorii]
MDAPRARPVPRRPGAPASAPAGENARLARALSHFLLQLPFRRVPFDQRPVKNARLIRLTTATGSTCAKRCAAMHASDDGERAAACAARAARVRMQRSNSAACTMRRLAQRA